MVMQGFKSFAKRTEIPFDKGINVFIGPNGSGKTNVADSLLFALGRLSIKSMRAAKARNLIFMGSKYVKPAKEAYVELIFDNSDRAFSINNDEISLKRIVRINGQSGYKINGELKTRNEVIEMLAQAGIDPYGFNLILQGQIQGIVKMHPDERRKIIEEVAGISIYESRKEKSLHELNKTDERLKEISTILRERTSYLRNLEREKAQAEKYKHSELMVKRAKASILSKRMEEKKKELELLLKTIFDKDSVKMKTKEKIEDIERKIEELNHNINIINKSIQQATGFEQETLHNDIADLRAEIEGLRVRRESYENRRKELERRIEQMTGSIPELENEIKELRKSSPLMAKKASELKKKKEGLNIIENERKKLLIWRAEFQALKDRSRDKERQLTRVQTESESLVKRMEELSRNLIFETETSCLNSIQNYRKKISENRDRVKILHQKELENERIKSVCDSSINNSEKLKIDMNNLDVCPLCHSKITEEHKSHVYSNAEENLIDSRNKKENAVNELLKIRNEREEILKHNTKLENDFSKGEIELINHGNVNEKKDQLKRLIEEEKSIKSEIERLKEKMNKLESKSSDVENIEEQYHRKIMEIEEISSRTNEDIDTTLLYKERELENINNIIKRSSKDLEDIGGNIGDMSEKLESKLSELEDKESKEEELQKQFKKMFEKRDSLQLEIQEKNISLSEGIQEHRQIDEQINYLKIGKAKLDAEREALEMELSEYPGIELLQGSIASIEDRLKKAQEMLQNIGSINMRALEVYEGIKKEYDIVQEKVDTLQKEKEQILKIIEEIDQKKKKTFIRTYKSLNSLFSENFAKLSSKGIAYLELENKEDIFSGGLTIVVKLAKGKYFDVTSLSGGEQTLVALSLLFAIQEYKPYHFYVFDEIDAALDKRNSERLSVLLNQYMKSGQYIVITHNDAIIINSNTLYGVSMHDGISKILSLKLNDSLLKNSLVKENQEPQKSPSEA